MQGQETHADPSAAFSSLSGERCYSFFPPTSTRTRNSKISIFFHSIEVLSQFNLFSALSHRGFFNNFQFLDVLFEKFPSIPTNEAFERTEWAEEKVRDEVDFKIQVFLSSSKLHSMHKRNFIVYIFSGSSLADNSTFIRAASLSFSVSCTAWNNMSTLSACSP